MIDIEKELKKYILVGNENKDSSNDDISELINIFNKTIEKIGKDQHKVLRNIDDIVDVLDENKENEELINSIKEKSDIYKYENKTLIKALLEIIDLFEDIYNYSLKSSNESFSMQVKLQWNNIEIVLKAIDFIRVGNIGDNFDSNIHIAKEIRKNINFTEDSILEVIKSGYIYKGRLIRKAEVVINKEYEIK